MSHEKENVELDNIIDLLKKSDDDGTFAGSLYDLYLFISVTKGVNDIRNGNGIPLEEFQKEMEELYANTNRRFS